MAPTYHAEFSISGPLLRTLPTFWLNGAHLHLIGLVGAKQIDRGLAVAHALGASGLSSEPPLVVVLVQDDRHAVVDRLH